MKIMFCSRKVQKKDWKYEKKVSKVSKNVADKKIYLPNKCEKIRVKIPLND